MGSTNKTKYLQLNSWVGSDVPCRNDFNRDNSIVDDTLGYHIKNLVMHVGLADRNKWDNPYIIQTYLGDGEVSKKIKINSDVNINWGLVVAINKPCVRCDYLNSSTYFYYGFFMRNAHSTNGLSFSNNELTVQNVNSQTIIGERYNLNDIETIYMVISFK